MNWRYPIVCISIACLSLGCNNMQQKGNSEAVSLEGFEVLASTMGNVQKAIRKSDKGKVLEEGDLVNGKKDGIWTTYHFRTGMVESVIPYQNGKRHGISLKMSDRGQLVEKMSYENDLLEGTHYKYKYSRVLEEAVYKKGELNGPRKLFYDDGKKIKEEGNFKNGKRDGINTWYKESGDISMKFEYANGKKVKDLTGEAATETEAKTEK